VDHSKKAHGEMDATAGSLRMRPVPAGKSETASSAPPPVLKLK